MSKVSNKSDNIERKEYWGRGVMTSCSLKNCDLVLFVSVSLSSPVVDTKSFSFVTYTLPCFFFFFWGGGELVYL